MDLLGNGREPQVARASSGLRSLGDNHRMPLDVASLWNFRDPAGSEEAFVNAARGAAGEDRLIALTQAARARGLQGDFDQARVLLDREVAPSVADSPEVEVRFHLERGRTFCSSAHNPEQIPDQAREEARVHYLRAVEVASAYGLDALAIDALHMMVCVDPAPEDQIAWTRKALALVDVSAQEDAKKWEGSLANNLGYALHLAGEYEEAIAWFERSRAAHVRAGKTFNVRVARWMIAWTERVRGNADLALALQHELEQDWASDNDSDPYVYQELEILYREKGDLARSAHYGDLARAGLEAQ